MLNHSTLPEIDFLLCFIIKLDFSSIFKSKKEIFCFIFFEAVHAICENACTYSHMYKHIYMYICNMECLGLRFDPSRDH